MIYRYLVSSFNVSKILKSFTPHFTCEAGFIGDEIGCRTLEKLRDKKDGLICSVDISSSGFQLDEYMEFYEWDGVEESIIEEQLGKNESEKLIKKAKDRKWRADEWLACAISDNSVAIRVYITGKRITIETGCVSADTEKTSACFEEGHLRGMPEIDSMIKDVIAKCIPKTKPKLPR